MSAILKTYIHKVGGALALQNYLLRDARSLSEDFSPDLLTPKNWGNEMDNFRRVYNKDSGRQVYHFIISPDVKENATLEQVKQLATNWVEENFSDSLWAIHYHNDGKSKIIHAHVVVNAVKLDGYKIQINAKQFNNIKLDVHNFASDLGMTTPAPKSEYDMYLENIENQKHEQPTHTFYRKETNSEKRIKSRGFKTWKQQLRDLIDINKSLATSWDNFIELMDKDGVEVRQTMNKKTGDLGYTYHFKEPVFNKKTGKEFFFACKDKNLSDDEKNPKKYTRAELYTFINFTDMQLPTELEVNRQKRLIHEETMKYFGYLPFIMPAPRKNQTGVVKPKHNLPKELKVVEPKTYRGKLTRATIRQSQANIQAMAEAMRIIKQHNIKSEKDLNNIIATNEQKSKELNANQSKAYDSYMKAVNALAKIKDYENAEDRSTKREAKSWLKERNINIKEWTSEKMEERLYEFYDQYSAIGKERMTLEQYTQQVKYAYNLIKENTKKNTLQRSNRTAGITSNMHAPYKITPSKPLTRAERLMQEQQKRAEAEAMDYSRKIQYWQELNSPRKTALEQAIKALEDTENPYSYRNRHTTNKSSQSQTQQASPQPKQPQPKPVVPAKDKFKMPSPSESIKQAREELQRQQQGQSYTQNKPRR